MYSLDFFLAWSQKGDVMPYSKRKFYWKGLRLVAMAVKRYIERNQPGLLANLTTPQYQCVLALLDAVITCLDALPVNTPS